jgi:hypothetical protein
MRPVPGALLMRTTRFPKPTGGYEGRRDWALRHAARLQCLVGAVEHGHLITAVTARPYGSSIGCWGVVKIWEYADRPDLGKYDAGYLWLPYD